MNDFFATQQIYLDIAKNRINDFLLVLDEYINEIRKNITWEKRGGKEIYIFLKRNIPIEKEINLSRDFGCITNELRSIQGTAVVSLSKDYGAPNTNENKLCYRVVRDEKSDKDYRKFLKTYNLPDKIIDVLLHIQPKNGFGDREGNRDENIIDLLDVINNENKHRQHLPIFLPKIDISRRIIHNNELIVEIIPIDDGIIGVSPFLKMIVAEEIEIDLSSINFDIIFDIYMKSDDVKYRNIATRHFLCNAFEMVSVCVGILRLYKHPNKRDFF